MDSFTDISEILSVHNVTVVKETIWTDRFHLALLDSNVLVLTALQAFEFDLDLLINFHNHNTAFIGNKPARFLIRLSPHYVEMPTPVLNYAANEPEFTNIKIAEAIVVKSLPNRLLANFYLKLSNNLVPSFLFNDTSKAYGWLLKNELRPEQLEKSV